MSELGDLLRSLRGDRSLREIARETGLSHTYIRDVERGYRRASQTPITPSPEALKKFSNVYHYPYGELMKLAGYMPESFDDDSLEDHIRKDPELRMIFRAADKLTEKEKALLLDLMKKVFPNAFQ